MTRLRLPVLLLLLCSLPAAAAEPAAPLDVKTLRTQKRDDVESSREAMRQTARFLTQHLRP